MDAGDVCCNWAGNLTYGAARLHRPASVEEVREIVAEAPGRVKALGTRHSFSRVADTDGDLVSLERLNRVLALDTERGMVTVEAGIRYGELSVWLDERGWALPNLASLPHIGVAGAAATGTHGSGVLNGSLATAAWALEMVTAGGDVVALSREKDGDRFAGSVVALGALGIVTQMRLAIEPRFLVRQTVYENLPLATAQADFDAVMGAAYSVSLFTDWQADRFHQVWVKERVPDLRQGRVYELTPPPPAVFHGARAADGPRHPIPTMPAENCTEQGRVPGPWHERLPHFRLDHTPSSGEELQSEYLMPRRHAARALGTVARMRTAIAPLLQVSEVRTVAGDDLWLSPAYGEDAVAIHFTWKKDWPAVRALLPEIEARLEPFGARPHWGKLFTTPAHRLHYALYSRRRDFQALRQELDPAEKFGSDFLDAYLGRP